MDQIGSASAVLDELGGTTAVARLLGRKVTAVSNWRRFDAFPANTYLALNAALRTKGKTAPASLWGMTEPSDPRPSEREVA